MGSDIIRPYSTLKIVINLAGFPLKVLTGGPPTVYFEIVCCIFRPVFRCCSFKIMVEICFYNILHSKKRKKAEKAKNAKN